MNETSALHTDNISQDLVMQFSDNHASLEKVATKFPPLGLQYYVSVTYTIPRNHSNDLHTSTASHCLNKLICLLLLYNDFGCNCEFDSQISVGCSVDVCMYCKIPKGRVSYKGNTKTLI